MQTATIDVTRALAKAVDTRVAERVVGRYRIAIDRDAVGKGYVVGTATLLIQQQLGHVLGFN